mmetsp:Transcript_12029/g.30429  ORF Transcript_12029/g.30429 Transcript_12029/m.30429 type:complete len:311 (-) Transcript_12029:190-1122(-)
MVQAVRIAEVVVWVVDAAIVELQQRRVQGSAERPNLDEVALDLGFVHGDGLPVRNLCNAPILLVAQAPLDLALGSAALAIQVLVIATVLGTVAAGHARHAVARLAIRNSTAVWKVLVGVYPARGADGVVRQVRPAAKLAAVRVALLRVCCRITLYQLLHTEGNEVAALQEQLPLKIFHGGEGPASAKVPLVLHRGHGAHGAPVEAIGQGGVGSRNAEAHRRVSDGRPGRHQYSCRKLLRAQLSEGSRKMKARRDGRLRLSGNVEPLDVLHSRVLVRGNRCLDRLGNEDREVRKRVAAEAQRSGRQRGQCQ